MEGDQKVEMSPSGGGAPPSTHRWNPTKEQITMLENLYKQGIRTPSAEQIQEITTKLKVYGHIEGKNVFYWFQNHKARQRQKLKQDNIACFNRYFQHPPNSPFYPPPYPNNVVRNPYYVPQCELGFYPQCPKLLLPGGRKWSVRLDNVEQPNPCNGESGQLEFHPTMPSVDNNQETLPLFPLHPTGVLKERTAAASNFSMGTNSSDNSTTTTTPSSSEGAGDQRFFDFFC